MIRSANNDWSEACLQPDVSVASLALRHGVNANLLRKWVAAHRWQQSNVVAAGAIEPAAKAFVPVVELCGVASGTCQRL